MKAAVFEFTTPIDLAGAALALRGGARVIAGGQSLGPMLNLRITHPTALVNIAKIPELSGVAETATHVVIGACVTHAKIADGLVPDIGQNVLARIAENIAYRAVRNRGTIGGSLCHADPAADWVTTLLALGAEALTFGDNCSRVIPLRRFITGAFRNALEPGEILRAVRIPRFTSTARWAYYKACRKPGDFAHAMAAVVEDRASGLRRVVIGAMGGMPLIFEGEQAAPAVIAGEFRALAGSLDDIAQHMQLIAVRRAFERLVA